MHLLNGAKSEKMFLRPQKSIVGIYVKFKNSPCKNWRRMLELYPLIWLRSKIYWPIHLSYFQFIHKNFQWKYLKEILSTFCKWIIRIKFLTFHNFVSALCLESFHNTTISIDELIFIKIRYMLQTLRRITRFEEQKEALGPLKIPNWYINLTAVIWCPMDIIHSLYPYLFKTTPTIKQNISAENIFYK